MITAAGHFADAAAAHGYRAVDRDVMVDAAAAFGIDLEEAADFV